MKSQMLPALLLLMFISLSSLLQAQDPVIGFTNSNQRYSTSKNPSSAIKRQWQTTAWRGEKIHTQLLVLSKKDLPQVQIKASDLQDGFGHSISADQVSIGFLRYVKTDEFRDGCGERKPEDFDSSLVTDPIEPISYGSVTANQAQPVWISVKVPAGIPAGTYTGKITVQTSQSTELQVAITVSNRILPPPADWHFALDLWQHPAAIARVHRVPLWSMAHYAVMRPYYTMLAEAGQKYITTSIIDEPWNHQTYDDFPSLIRWIKQKDGSWRYDYSLFDQYVEFVMSCGINKGINCYSMVPWKVSFRYYDEALGTDTTLVAAIGSEAYNQHWGTMLKDFTAHLKAKGWFGITRIAMDERPMKDMQAVIALLRSIDPNWKLALAGEYHPEIERDIFDYCVASKFQFTPAALQERNASGKFSTYYTCCVEAKPNIFSFSPPAEASWLGWYAAAAGFNGYLRWAFNSWVKDPVQDSRFRAWPAGDTYQIYPGPWTSQRFEKLIEGIQDFEKIRILREEFTRKGETAKLAALNKLLSGFTLAALDKKSAEAMLSEAGPVLNKF